MSSRFSLSRRLVLALSVAAACVIALGLVSSLTIVSLAETLPTGFIVLFASLATVVLAVLGWVAWISVMRLARPLQQTELMVSALAGGGGDLTHRLAENGHGLGQLTEAINLFTEDMHTLILALKDDADRQRRVLRQMTDEVDVVHQSSQSSAQETKQLNRDLESLDRALQASSEDLSGIRETMESLASKIEEQTEAGASGIHAIRELLKSVSSVADVVHEKQSTSSTLVNVTDEGSNKVGETNRLIEEVSRDTNEIIKLIRLIDDVAEQTNLLSINAAIQASHAGEAGKEFSVVASSIRRLSNSTRQNANQITASLTQSVEKIKLALKASKDSGESFAHINAYVRLFNLAMVEVQEKVEAMKGGAQRTFRLIETMHNLTVAVGDAALNAGKSVSDILEHVASVQGISTQTRKSCNKLKQSVDRLEELSGRIHGLTSDSSSLIGNMNRHLDHYQV